MVEQVASTPGVDTPRRIGLAMTHAELGRTTQARALLDTITGRELGTLRVDTSWLIAMAAMAEAAAASGHRDAAAAAYERLQPYRARIAITAVTATGPVAHHVGLAAWVLDERAAAVTAFDEAIELADSVGAVVFAARSRVALAERLASVGTDLRAERLARDARRVAVAQDLRSLLARCDAVLGQRPRTARSARSS
jgi:hypothetical protein